MNIEILTTKRKLTKSILSQLESVTFSNMETFNSLNSPGYYINTPKGRVFLVETHSGWRKLIEMTPEEYERVSSRSVSSRSIMNNNPISVYNKFIRKCKNHLII